MDDKNLDVKLALEEMRFNMQQSLNAGDALDQKANVVLVAAGLTMAAATAIQISLSSDRPVLFWILLFAAIGLYILAVAAVVWVTSPQSYHLAIASEWEELDKCLFGKPERDAILTLLSGYVDQIQQNLRLNHQKAVVFRLCLALLSVVVILVVVLTIIH